MDSVSLVLGIMGTPKGCVLPMAYALDVIGELMFEQHIAMEDCKMCEVCRQVSERLPYKLKPDSVNSEVRRWANSCSDTIKKEGWTVEYFGKQISDHGRPRHIMLCLATLAYFDKPFYQMVQEHGEYFTGQLSRHCRKPSAKSCNRHCREHRLRK